MKKLSVAVALCAALATNYASAEVRINGFASIVGGKSLDSDSTLYGMMMTFHLKTKVSLHYSYQLT